MNFLQANKALKFMQPKSRAHWMIAMSGTPDLLSLFMKAHAALLKVRLDIDTLPFGTLSQHLITPKTSIRNELIIVLPYDFIPECDPRSGIVEIEPDLEEIIQKAKVFGESIKARPDARVVYWAAPLMPISFDQAKNKRLQSQLASIIADLEPLYLPSDIFSMSTYLASGCPTDGANLSRVSEMLLQFIEIKAEPAKILVTDLDNTIWNGVIAEDGIENIQFRAEGAGFKHFIYQTLLLKLQAAGVLLAAVSRNDADLVIEPFASKKMPLCEKNFVAIQASYGTKSGHIQQLAKHLNIGLDSFVFVDDNPVEIEEVAKSLPEVRVLLFPKTEREFSVFVDQLMSMFSRSEITAEDRMRLKLYQMRNEIIPPTGNGSSHEKLAEFLKELDMSITIHDRSQPVGERAIQLINKTNQFNMNGRRLTFQEVSIMVEKGSKLYTASLKDRAGDHGEIISLIIAPDSTVTHFVMSCRVFQRQVEFAIVEFLLRQYEQIRFEYVPTERNTPFRNFIETLRLPADFSIKAGDSCQDMIIKSSKLFKINAPKSK